MLVLESWFCIWQIRLYLLLPENFLLIDNVKFIYGREQCTTDRCFYNWTRKRWGPWYQISSPTFLGTGSSLFCALMLRLMTCLERRLLTPFDLDPKHSCNTNWCAWILYLTSKAWFNDCQIWCLNYLPVNDSESSEPQGSLGPYPGAAACLLPGVMS